MKNEKKKKNETSRLHQWYNKLLMGLRFIEKGELTPSVFHLIIFLLLSLIH